MDGRSLFDDPARMLIGGLLVFLNQINSVHQYPARFRINLKYFPLNVFILSVDDLYPVPLFYLQFWCKSLFHNPALYNTSGANDTILICCLSRNSRATGPKILVPLGSPAAFNRTTALSSKRI